MDEILIEEKKYVSSKRAAQITGYAKDYIGQLCREGRVPARLVGRSWYVLDSAIQDHRFGAESVSPTATAQEKGPGKIEATKTWGTPLYATTEPLNPSAPPINRLQKGIGAEEPKDLQELWKNWFDHFQGSVGTVALVQAATPASTAPIMPVGGVDEVFKEEEEEVSVPLHIKKSQEYPPRELLPRRIEIPNAGDAAASKVDEERNARPSKRNFRWGFWPILVFMAVAAVSSLIVAIGSSGVMDDRLKSFDRGAYFFGISSYIKHYKI